MSDSYESKNEEWLGIYKKALNGDSVALKITTSACRIGTLQCALLSSSSKEAEYINGLLRQTMQEINMDASSPAYLKQLECLAPQHLQRDGSSSNNKTPPSASQVETNAFFEEYPECMKDGDGEDESDDDSSIDEVEEILVRPRKEAKARDKDQEQQQPQHPAVVDNPYQKRVQNPLQENHTSRTINPYQNSSQNQISDTNSNSFQYSQATQDHSVNANARAGSNNASWGNNSVSNSRSSNQHQRQFQRQNQQPRQSSQNNSNYTTTTTSWESHQNQSNPFQTAREVAQVEESESNSNPQKNHHQNNSHNNWNQQSQSGHNICATQHPPQQQQGTNPYATHYPPHSSEEPSVVRGGPSIPDSLKRKFQPPKRVEGSKNDNIAGDRQNYRGSAPVPNRNGGGVQVTRASSSSGRNTSNNTNSNNNNGEGDEELPEELQHLDKELVKKIQNEIMESGDTITFDDIAGLDDAKQTVQEVVCWPMKRPDLFTGLRRAPNGLLLYGPPGTGKTLIGKAIAYESGATFFSISSSSLTSKWIGEGEKLVRTLFAVAAYREPAVVFIDEIDSLLTQRKSSENEASRRIKTEFLVQLDGTGTSGQGRVLVIGATNRPQELDEAARRRFTKRLYIPLPNEQDRCTLLLVMLDKNNHKLTESDIQRLAKETGGFSGADLKALCTDAAMGPIRQLGSNAMNVSVDEIPPISFKHFKRSLKGTRPSVAEADLQQYFDFDESYGTKCAEEEDYSSDDD